MSGRLALLCPGQGMQGPAMFDLVRSHAQVAALIPEWLPPPVLGGTLDDVLRDPARLFANRHAQPMIVAATLAVWEALRPHLPTPEIVAGYSVGEVSACAVAGALPAADAVALAAERAVLMDACAMQTPPQIMAAVSGLPLSVAATMVHAHGFRIAIETGGDSAIAGGLAARANELADVVQHAGGRVTVLPVSIASHTPWMQDAADRFAAVLARAPLVAPDVALVAGISGEVVRDAPTLRHVMAAQISNTIHWTACMDACVERGVDTVLELGPGAGLSGIWKARYPQIECRSVADFRSLSGVATWLVRRLER